MKDLTTFLIDHEITQPKNAMSSDMKYEESKIKDPSTHNNHIERICYFERIDKVLLYEENMKNVRVYRGDDMTFVMDIVCDSNILSIEYCGAEKNAIAISLANRTIVFLDGSTIAKSKEGESGRGTNFMRKLHVPCTQKCLRYIKRKQGDLLFAAAVNGNIFAFNLKALFDHNESNNAGMGDKDDEE
jgi:hypothetical protein